MCRCEAQGVARFSFGDLCEKPLGASDYLKLAHDYHTLFIEHVPMMDYGDRNAAKRFIALIDTLYDNAVKLMASAAGEPHALYRASEGFEAMEFARTASRLFEMGSETYLALPHGRSDSTASGDDDGAGRDLTRAIRSISKRNRYFRERFAMFRFAA